MDSTIRHTCLKLQTQTNSKPESIFVKGTWYPSHFHLSITNGHDAWTCHASEEEVRERASQWDQPVSEYIELGERYLGFQQPGSVYAFSHPAGTSHWRLSWTFEKEGTKLEWRWKCHPSPDSKRTTTEILDFLMDSNIRLSEEVVRKTQSFDRLKVEAEKCLSQSEKFNNEKVEFEAAIFEKFVGVLNSKKAKLRELRDQLSKKKTSGKFLEEGDEAKEEKEEESTDKTETYDGESDDDRSEAESTKNVAGTSKNAPSGRVRGRRRK